jgi:hypothetical protein
VHACRWLDENDPLRDKGVPEADAAPAPRTNDETYAQSVEAEEYCGFANAHPKEEHGINGWCVLHLAPMFDIIWDVCPDMMHVLKNFFDRFFVALPSGERIPNVQKSFKKPTRTKKESDDEFAAQERKFEKETERYAKAKKQAHACTFSDKSKKQVDVRIRKLAAIKSSGIPYSMVPFKTLPGRRKQKVAAWVTLLRFYMPYILYGVGPRAYREAILQVTEALRAVMLGSCDYDAHDEEKSEEAKDRCMALKKRLVLALCELERCLPESEFSIFLHEVVHVADFLFRWNNVRNYWCFITERFVGYVKGFVKNRHLVLENLVQTNNVHIMYTSYHANNIYVHIMYTSCLYCSHDVYIVCAMCTSGAHYVHISYVLPR